jgi:uncharacterized OB-fold protein
MANSVEDRITPRGRKCPKCNSSVSPGAKRCKTCGASLSKLHWFKDMAILAIIALIVYAAYSNRHLFL